MRTIPRIANLIWILVCLGLGAGALHAAEVGALYEAEVTVSDRSAESRRLAMAQALEQVLVKVSGQSNPGLLLGAERLEQSAPRYVLQYRYRNIQPQPLEEGQPVAGEGSEAADVPLDTLALWVKFDEKGVEGLLRENDLPVWGSARPMTLVWLAVERHGRRYLVGTHDQGPTPAALQEAAAERALPLSLPLLDLEDQERVQVVDVGGGFEDTLLSASKRYPAQAVLIGRLEAQHPSEYRARWDLHEGDKVWRWQSSEFSFDALVASGVYGAAERLSMRFVEGFQSGGGPVALEVSGLYDLIAYRKAVDYLSSLHGVKRVRVSRVGGESVSFLLDVDGSSDNVVQTIALGDTLVPESAEPDGAPPLSTGPTDPAAAPSLSPGSAAIPSLELRYRLLP